MTDANPIGVMNEEYARQRQLKKSLVFRYRMRAETVVDAVHRISSGLRHPAIMDLGSADGLTMVRVHDHLGASESLGLEYDESLISAAPEMPDGCRLVQRDVCAPLPNEEQGRFDLVTALAILEHLDEPAALYRTAFSALRPGGLLVASCPSPAWDRISGSVGLHQDEFHAVNFDRQLFERLAVEAGFVPVEYRRFMFVPVAFLPYLGVGVSPSLAVSVDRFVTGMRIFEFLFINQLFVARKP